MRMISQKAPFPKVAKRLGGEGSGQQEKEQRRRQKGKCGVLPGGPHGALQAHSLAANLPCEASAAPLPLAQAIALSGQVGVRDVDWSQSKWSGPRAEQGQGEEAPQAVRMHRQALRDHIWSLSAQGQGESGSIMCGEAPNPSSQRGRGCGKPAPMCTARQRAMALAGLPGQGQRPEPGFVQAGGGNSQKPAFCEEAVVEGRPDAGQLGTDGNQGHFFTKNGGRRPAMVERLARWSTQHRPSPGQAAGPHMGVNEILRAPSHHLPASALRKC